MRFERMHGALDERRLIVDDLDGEVLGQCGLNFLQPRLDGVGGGHGVLAGLLGDHQCYRGIAVEARGGDRFFLGILGVTDIADLDHVRTAANYGQFVELRGIDQPSQRADR